MFELKSVDEIVKIAESGGNFQMEAFIRKTDDLVKIAQAANIGNGQVIFGGLNLRKTSDLIKISDAGKGNVLFVDEIKKEDKSNIFNLPLEVLWFMKKI